MSAPHRSYHNFEVLFSASAASPGQYTARISGALLSGRPAADEQETLSYDPAVFKFDDGGIEIDLLDKLSARTIEKPHLFRLGKLLSDIFLPGSIRRRLREELLIARERGLCIRIHFVIQANALRGLPCEYMYLSSGGVAEEDALDFLALHPLISIVRELGIDAAQRAPAAREQYRMVAAFASPPQQPALNLAADRQALEAMTGALSAHPLDVSYLDKATRDDLLAALRSPADIFHFSGHGAFDGGKGQIILEGSDYGDYFNAELLGNLLRDAQVRFAVLSACETGELSGANVWGAVVTELHRAGVAAVVASQFRLRDENANLLTITLYRELLGGATVDEALYRTRQAIYQKSGLEDRDWGALVLYASTSTGAIFPPQLAGAAQAMRSAAAAEAASAVQPDQPRTANAEAGRDRLAHDDAASPLAAVHAGKPLSVRNIAHLKSVAVLAEHADAVLSIAFSRDGKLLATGCGDGRVRVWDVAAGSLLKTLTDHTGPVNCVGFSPHGRPLLASGSSDETLCVWDTFSYERLYQWKDQTGGVGSLAFSPDGSLLATASGSPNFRSSTLAWWDLLKGKKANSLYVSDGHIYSLAFRPDSPLFLGQPATVAAGLGDFTSQIRLYAKEKPAPVHTFKGQAQSVRCVAYTPDGQVLASGSDDKTIYFWDSANPGQVVIWTGLLPVNALAYSSDGALLAAVRQNNLIVITAAADSKALCILDKHESTVNAVAFSPDGRTVATASQDRTARLWRVH